MEDMWLPWATPPLDDWSICGMNHYFVDGKRNLFVSMVKKGRCIKAEGENEELVWVDLMNQARL